MKKSFDPENKARFEAMVDAMKKETRKMNRKKVYEVIDSERDFQDRKWGSIDQHPHEVGAYITLMRKHLRDAEEAWCSNNGDYLALEEIRKIVAIGVACGEQHGFRFRSKHQEVERMREEQKP